MTKHIRRSVFLLLAPVLMALGIVFATPSIAHAADPVHTFCLASASEGYYTTSSGANWIRRHDTLGIYPDLKVWEGQCKQATFNSTSDVYFNGYYSWRVTSKLDTTNISDYGSCHTGTSHPASSVKYLGYRNTTCTFTTPGAGGSGIVPAAAAAEATREVCHSVLSSSPESRIKVYNAYSQSGVTLSRGECVNARITDLRVVMDVQVTSWRYKSDPNDAYGSCQFKTTSYPQYAHNYYRTYTGYGCT